MLRKTVLAFVLGIGSLTATLTLSTDPTYSAPPELSCKGNQLVWVNTNSGIYHYRGERYFGRTKQGKLICEKEALQEGDRPTRNGQ